MTARGATIPALTGLRTVAAGMIFFYHWFFDEAKNLPLLMRAPFDVGYVGVVIFFALSGFLITVRYHERWQQGRLAVAKYLLRRLVRLYPLYFVVLTLFVIVLGRPRTMVPQGLRAMFAAYSLLQGLFPSLLLIGTAVGWTLTVELMFYLIAPMLTRWLGQGVSTRSLIVRACVAGLVAVLLGLLLARLPLTDIVPDTLAGAPVAFILHYSLFGHLVDFLAGMVCGFLFLRRGRLPVLDRLATPLVWGGLLGTWASILALDLVNVELGSPVNRMLAFGAALSSSGMILGLALDFSRNVLVTRFLGSRVLVSLGSLSYALFLVQLTEPCQWIYWVLLGERLGVQDRILRALLLYLVATGLALILYHLVERPAYRWLSARLAQA